MTPARRTTVYVFLLYALFILLLLFLPLDGLGSFMGIRLFGSIRLGYLLHVAAFIPLVPLWKRNWPSHPFRWVLAASIIIAAGLEGVHHILPYRNFDGYDLTANISGILLGALTLLVNTPRKG